jgi:hypothetical protein
VLVRAESADPASQVAQTMTASDDEIAARMAMLRPDLQDEQILHRSRDRIRSPSLPGDPGSESIAA